MRIVFDGQMLSFIKTRAHYTAPLTTEFYQCAELSFSEEERHLINTICYAGYLKASGKPFETYLAEAMQLKELPPSLLSFFTDTTNWKEQGF